MSEDLPLSAAWASHEDAGFRAAQELHPVSDCPRGSAPQLRRAWILGWIRGEEVQRHARLRAVVAWALPLLERALDLARGYGQEEIAAVLGSVPEKLEAQMGDPLRDPAFLREVGEIVDQDLARALAREGEG
jgi:hypothetical protein